MPDATIQNQIDAIIENAINETQLVGASVGVMRDNEVVLARGYGYADLNKKVEATEHTVYQIGLNNETIYSPRHHGSCGTWQGELE